MNIDGKLLKLLFYNSILLSKQWDIRANVNKTYSKNNNSWNQKHLLHNENKDQSLLDIFFIYYFFESMLWRIFIKEFMSSLHFIGQAER